MASEGDVFGGFFEVVRFVEVRVVYADEVYFFAVFFQEVVFV